MKRSFQAGLLVVVASILPYEALAQLRKVRVATPGYTVSMISFFAAKAQGYYAAEGLDVELLATRAPTANLAVLSGSVEFSAVPLAGLTTALRGGPLKLLFVPFDKPQHELFAKPEIQGLRSLRGKKIAVAGIGTIGEVILSDYLTANGIDPAHDVNLLAMGSPETRLSTLLSGNVDAAQLIAPYTIAAANAGFRAIVVFKDHNFILPSGGIVVRDDLLKSDAAARNGSDRISAVIQTKGFILQVEDGSRKRSAMTPTETPKSQPRRDGVIRCTALLACVHECATKTLDELPNYPCRMDEMTARELKIADICSQLCGSMKWIKDATEQANL